MKVWWCCNCWTEPEPDQQSAECKNKIYGCTYADVNAKTKKHKAYYCPYKRWCHICLKGIPGTTLDAHYTEAHGDITYRAGTVGTVRPANTDKWLMIQCDFGRAVCRFWREARHFLLHVYTALASAQLYKYRCTVHLRHPKTGHTLTRTAAVEYSRQEDWIVRIPREDYDMCVHDGKVDIRINITSTDNKFQTLEPRKCMNRTQGSSYGDSDKKTSELRKSTNSTQGSSYADVDKEFHTPEQRTCSNSTRGCTYTDVDKKCVKHEQYYCQYNTWCSLCSADITGTTLDAHYTQAHGDITYRAGTVGTVSPVIGDNWLSLLNICDFGRAVCRYMLLDSDFVLHVHTPISAAQLYKYSCTVDLGHPDLGYTLTRTAAVEYSRQEDWYVCIPRSAYEAHVYDKKGHVRINITKIEDPSQVHV